MNKNRDDYTLSELRKYYGFPPNDFSGRMRDDGIQMELLFNMGETLNEILVFLKKERRINND